MCGIAGLLQEAGRGLEQQAAAMTETLAHRGPDARGTWADARAGIAFGHRRLAIQDPTPDGAQPMSSASGRWVLTYNGELYSPALRHRLECQGTVLRGHSDTEVLVEALDRWGVRETLPHLNGIFAFAAWDVREQTLWLVRDCFGVKPLYYSRTRRALLFASELRALRAHPDVDRTVDPAAVSALLQQQSVPAPLTVYRGASKLPAGHLLHVRTGQAPVVERWWDPVTCARAARRRPLAGSEQEVLDALEGVLSDAVGDQLVSDVPLGAFLSGGVDSSLVVALMRRRSAAPVRTFAVGFEDPRLDESGRAEAVARHLGTDHTTLMVREADLFDVVPSLGRLWDEPFADASQLPMFLVSREARTSVTVALSGDGGDELFAGYSTYGIAERAWRTLAPVPLVLRRQFRRPLAHDACDVVGELMGAAPAHRRERFLRRAHRTVDLLDAASATQVHARLGRRWRGRPPVLGAGSLHEADAAPALRDFSALDQMMLRDATTYMTDTVLTKVDRASMAVGLEVRVPLLDPRVFEAAWRLPVDLRARAGRTKWALRALLDRHVPAALVDRPKQGFGVPLGDWLRGPLRPWAEDLLSPARLAASDVLDTGVVRRAWTDHVQGRPREDDLWPVLMFQSWRDNEESM